MKICKILFFLIGFFGLSLFLFDFYNSQYARQNAYNYFLAELKKEAKDKEFLKSHIQKIQKQISSTGKKSWYDLNMALFNNGEWVLFKVNSSHKDSQIGNLTVGLSNKNELIVSNFHFADSINFDEVYQPESLKEFLKDKYFKFIKQGEI